MEGAKGSEEKPLRYGICDILSARKFKKDYLVPCLGGFYWLLSIVIIGYCARVICEMNHSTLNRTILEA
jgi:hypothetical protein